MSTGDKIALVALVVTTVVALGVPLALRAWGRRDELKIVVKAEARPHIFQGCEYPFPLHGLAIEITCLSQAVAEIIDVRLRLVGVDATASLLAGFSGTISPERSKVASAEDVGVEVQLRLEHDGSLIRNSNEHRGIKLGRNQRCRFFTPLPIYPLELQHLFDNATPESVSVVASILPEKRKVILEGESVLDNMRASLSAYRGQPIDPNYTWEISAFTVTSELPSSLPIGRVNDKAISIGDAERLAGKPPVGRKLLNTLASTFSFMRRPKGHLAKNDGDFATRILRSAVVASFSMNVEELMAVPRGRQNEFHPITMPIGHEEALDVLKQLQQTIAAGSDFEMSFAFARDERPLTVSFAYVGTAAWALFAHKEGADVKYMHGLLALLPRKKVYDDDTALDSVRQFACLREVPAAAFERARGANRRPMAAMFYADLGSANYPPLFTVVQLLSIAFFTSQNQVS